MEIRFYDEWDKRNRLSHRVADESTHSNRNGVTIALIILSIASAFFFSFLIFAGQDGQAVLSGQVQPQKPASPQPILYTVKQGDTLWAIAGQYYPEKSKEEAVGLIKETNGMQTSMIHAGQTILLP